jgi:type 1 fimbriae regulatory protein FimB
MHASNTARFLSPEELLALLRVARERRVRDWCMILISYWHGLRMSEVCALKLTDISDGVLTVRRRQGSLTTVQPLHRDRRQPLLDEVTAIKAWLKRRPNVCSDVLFISRNGGALYKTQFFRNFRVAADAAGLPAAKSHPGILRYSLASHLVARNADLALIAKALGHRSTTNTLNYVKAIGRRTKADSFAAIAQKTRLRILRLIVRHAPKDLAAGVIARRLRLRRPNLSFHLNVLTSAELIQPHKEGTSISYSANPQNLNRLTKFLI